MKIGDRVCAVKSATKTTVHIFGFGVYDGEHEKEMSEGVTIKNPRITLDLGKQVWGFECWWGPEEKLKKWVGEREIVIVQEESVS